MLVLSLEYQSDNIKWVRFIRPAGLNSRPNFTQYDWEFCEITGAYIFTFLLTCDHKSKSRPKIHGYTGCKRTCAVEQAVSCIWPVHETKCALLSTGGSLELGSLHTRGALFRESMSHQPRVLIGNFLQSNGRVGRCSDWFKEQRVKSTQGLRTMYHALHVS